MKYKSNIMAIGSMALDFAGENMLILFGEKANSGLEDYSIIIKTPKNPITIHPGDIFIIGEETYTITAVGERASELFSTLGHCTLCFDAAQEARLPGSIHLKGNYPSCEVGAVISISESRDG